MGHVVIAVPLHVTGESLRPYVSGGLGMVRPRFDDFLGVFRAEQNLLGMSLGGGLIGFFTERTGIRWDIRRFRTVKGVDESATFTADSTRLSFWRGTVGVVLRY
jgi:hypothetical protein